jgi:hypothetical protein
VQWLWTDYGDLAATTNESITGVQMKGITVAVPESTAQKLSNSIVVTVPGWRGRLAKAIIAKRWWAIVLAAVLALYVLSLVLGGIALGSMLLGTASRSQPGATGAWQLVEYGAFLILIALAVAGGAAYDYLWATRGSEAIEFSKASIKTRRFFEFGNRTLPAGWPKTYRLDQIDHLYVSSGPGWHGRIKFTYRRGIRKRVVRLAGSLTQQKAEALMKEVKNRFPTYDDARLVA